MLEILNYINDKNIIYNSSDIVPDGYKHNDYQLKTLPRNITKCNGITMLAAYLFDKANLEHRFVVNAFYSTEKRRVQSGPSHIYNEVKINNTWYKVDLTNILGQEGQLSKPYYKITKSFYNSSFGLNEEFPTLPIAIDKDYEDMVFWVSKIYNSKEKIENNVDSIYVWTGDDIYSCYENFKKEIK